MPGQFDLEDDEDLEEELEEEEEEKEESEDDDEGAESDDDEAAEDDDKDESDEDSEESSDSTGENESATAGTESKSSGRKVPLAALQDERRKRQALERRLELMEARFDGMDSRKPKEGRDEEEPEIVITDDEFLTEPSKALAKQREADRLRREKSRKAEIFERDLEDASLLFDDFEEVFTDENVKAWRESTPGAEALVAKSRAPVKLAYRGIKKMKAREAEGDRSEADEELRRENAELKKKLSGIEKRLSKPTRSVGRKRSTMKGQSAKDPADSPWRMDW